jgi:hypothetical protein
MAIVRGENLSCTICLHQGFVNFLLLLSGFFVGIMTLKNMSLPLSAHAHFNDMERPGKFSASCNHGRKCEPLRNKLHPAPNGHRGRCRNPVSEEIPSHLMNKKSGQR